MLLEKLKTDRSVRRIAFVLKNLAGGGAERVMLHLAGGLASAGEDVLVIVSELSGPLANQVPANVSVRTLGSGRTARSVLPLARAFTATRPNLVVSALVHINTAAVLASRICRSSSPKVILTEHNQISTNKNEADGMLVRLVYDAMPWTYPLADHVVAVSKEVAEEVRHFSKLRAEKISVIHNPIVHQGLSSLGAQPPDHLWFHDDKIAVILAAGSLTKQKGFSDLITAFSLLPENAGARLVIVGEGPERQNLRNQIDHLGLSDRVDLLGFVQNPFQYFAHARLFVLSSLWEGFPTVLVEAMYFGTPIVATDCKSGPREILKDGSMGRLVSVSAPEDLKNAMVAALAEGPAKRESLIHRARQFDIPNAVGKYQKLIDRVAA